MDEAELFGLRLNELDEEEDIDEVEHGDDDAEEDDSVEPRDEPDGDTDFVSLVLVEKVDEH